jgi:hypothetical protein
MVEIDRGSYFALKLATLKVNCTCQQEPACEEQVAAFGKA